MFNYTNIIINLIIIIGLAVFISQTLFFILFTGGGSARHLRGCTAW